MGWKFNPSTGQIEDDISTSVLGTKLDGIVDTSKYNNMIDSTSIVNNPVNAVSPTSGGLAYNSVISGPNPWTAEQWRNFGSQGGTIDANNNLVFGTNNMQTGASKNEGMFDWLGSDSMKGVGTIGGLAMSGLGLWNAMGAQKEAKRQWEAENARADEIMAMNREKYNQYKADRDRLNTGYGGK